VVKYWIGLLLYCVFQPLFAADIAVQLDRSMVEIDESFTLVFSAAASVDDDPDFKPLDKDFRILNRNKSSSIQIMNGSMSRESTWTLSVMAKRTGTLTIPAIQFGSDSSKKLNIVINKSGQNSVSNTDALIYMEVDVSPKQVYVQAQVIYTIRIFHAVNFLDASLTELSLDDSNAVVETIGNNASYDKQINGRLYKVFEKKYAIFPQKSGSIRVEPFVFEARYIGQRRQIKHRRLRSQAFDLKVLPKPPFKNGKTAAYWLPTSSLQIFESWGDKPPEFTVGEPVTRTFRLTAVGLPASQLPYLHTEKLDFAKLYPDQPLLNDDTSANGLIGIRMDKVALIPTKPGKFTLPEIRVPWWNTNKKRWENLIVKAKTISVAPALASMGDFITPQQINKSENITTQHDTENILNNRDDNDLFGFDQTFWFALSVLFLYLWLLTIAAWWYYAKKAKKAGIEFKDKNTSSTVIPAKNRMVIEKRLTVAGEAGEPDDIKNLLIDWGVTVFPDNSPHSLGALAKRCGGTLGEEIEHINKVIYSNTGSEWNIQTVLPLMRRFLPEDEIGQRDNELDPMYYHVSGKVSQ